jgi:hypothetical protein
MINTRLSVTMIMRAGANDQRDQTNAHNTPMSGTEKHLRRRCCMEYGL